MDYQSVIKTIPTRKPHLAVICGVHGDEQFGLRAFRFLKERQEKLGISTLILAHPAALSQKKRFIESDLNRSFPGRVDGTVEEKIAAGILPYVRSADYVIDLHTTVSDIKIAPVITKFNQKTRRLINACPVENIALICARLKGTSLIDQCKGGISIEFNRRYAVSREPIQFVEDMIYRVMSDVQIIPRKRRIFCINGVIPKKINLPDGVANFRKISSLNCYPFLYHESSYEEFHCFSANRFKREII